MEVEQKSDKKIDNNKFEKSVKYENEMTDDVMHSTQYWIKYMNRVILVNLHRRPLKFRRLIVLQKTHLWL